MPNITFSQHIIQQAAGLRFEHPDPDSGATTVREYMRALLARLWERGEGFSGKRPFGNSDWELTVFREFVRADLIDGELRADGSVHYDRQQAEALVQAVIIVVCAVPEY